jgi:hypothetical protein
MDYAQGTACQPVPGRCFGCTDVETWRDAFKLKKHAPPQRLESLFAAIEAEKK